MVKKPMASGLREYKTFNVKVLNHSMDVSGTEIDHFGLSVETDIWHALRDMGLERVFSNAQLRVECQVNRTWGLPRVGRNFYWHWKYKGMENIQIIEALSGKLIGEVEYRRPRCSLPPDDLTKTMIESLVNSHIPASSTNSLPKSP